MGPFFLLPNVEAPLSELDKSLKFICLHDARQMLLRKLLIVENTTLRDDFVIWGLAVLFFGLSARGGFFTVPI